MAHYVICKYCGERFDRDKEQCVQVNAKRYAHNTCYKKYLDRQSQDERDYNDLIAYIKNLFNTTTVSAKILKQIVTFRKDYNYTYTGMKKTLHWFYEIQQNPIEKANNGIGIIPYVYDEASQYYYALFLAKKKNEGKNIKQYKPKEKVVFITRPIANRKERKFFDLDREGDDE